MKQKLILLILVVGLTIVSQSSLSLGMGKIQVYSALNEPLQSSIELLGNADEELLNLEVKLASSEDYQKVGLDKSFVPGNIMVAFDEENPMQINVTSNGPVSEPIVSLLLDVNWNNGRILREFTVLLDPPVYEAVNTAPAMNEVVVEPMQDDSITEPLADDPVSPEPELQPREQETQVVTNADFADVEQAVEVEQVVAAEPETPTYSTASEVYVEAGDTLWRIANNNKVGDLSAQQMMMAIYNKNPSAFIDNNINKLIKGSRLEMPSNDEASDIGFSEAMAQVESHHQSWTPVQQDFSSYQTSTEPVVDEQDTSSTLDYGVQLSGGDNEGADGGQSNAEDGTAGNVQAMEEDLYNQTAENTDLKERISELEDIVEQQQDAIEISDDGLANLENQLENAGEEAVEGVNQLVEGAGDMVDETVAAADDIWDQAIEGSDESEDDLTLNVDVVDTAVLDDTVQTNDFDTENQTMVDENVDSADTTNDAADNSAQAETSTATTTPEKYVPPQEKSLVDSTINWVMDNLMWVLIGLVGLIVLLFLPRVLRGGDDEDDDETSFLDDIKNRNKATEENEPDDVETKMNQPLQVDEGDDGEDADDVLAELDSSIDFDGNGADEIEVHADAVEDDITELTEAGEFESADEDGFDLDGFLNDNDVDDSTITKDHAETLAAATLSTEEEADDAFELSDDMSFDADLDLDEDLSDLSDDVEEAVEDLTDEMGDTVEEISDDVDDIVTDAQDEIVDEVDDFSFDESEDFDFDLEEELEELAQADDIDSVTDGDTEDAELTADSDDETEEFNDMLDISDEDNESFEIIEEDQETNMDDEIDLGLEDLMDDTDAIDTKLDLAKAYIEMGDAEGAKNLLDEIYAEGSEEQIEAAKKLLDGM